MNNLKLAVQTIKDTISAQDVGRKLGLEIRHGRCKCPLHGGTDYNCVLYPGNRGFYCHVCKIGGDVIKFAQEYHGTSFHDTVAWFSDAFGLGLDIDSPMNQDALKQALKTQREREAKEAFKKWEEEMRFKNALTSYEVVRILETQRDENVPKTPDESWTAPFCQAVELLPMAKQMAEDAWFDCTKEVKT